MRVLIFAAHPDDEVLGMGGTLALHAEYWHDEVRTVCLTDGASAQYPAEPEKRAVKSADARRASESLGVSDYVHLDLPNIGLREVPHLELNAVVEEQVKSWTPSLVYTVHPDGNADHAALFESVAVAVRPGAQHCVSRFFTYPAWSSVEWTSLPPRPFVPNWYVDIGSTLGAKLTAFSQYTTELRPYPHPRSERAVKSLAETAGTAAGCNFAEAFVLIRARQVDGDGKEPLP